MPDIFSFGCNSMLLKWMILNKELSFNGSIAGRKFRAPNAVSISSAIIQVFCHAIVPWMSKKLRVTSPLLIVLASKEGNHWVLVTLPFIRRLWPHPIQMELGNVGVTYERLAIRVFSFIPFHWNRAYPHSTSNIGRIWPNSYLVSQGKSFIYLEFLSPPDVMTQLFLILWS